MKPVEPRPIEEYALGIFDGPHATPKESSEGAVFLGIKNITEDGQLDFSEIRHVSDEELPKWTRRVTPQPGDVVFTYEATLHRYAIIPEGFRGCLGRRVALLRPNPIEADSRYLLYYFQSHQWRKVVEAHVITGATVDRIPLEKFPGFPASLPNLTVQREIAGILSAYDELIENNRRRMVLLEDAARLLYREWFVRLRFPGHEHTPVVDGVPESWERKPLESAFVLQRGFDLPTQERQDGSVPIYGSTGICGYHSKPKVDGPGVVTGRSGTLGEVHYTQCDFWPLNTALWVREFRCVTPLYALFLLRSMDLKQYNGGVSVPTLDRKSVHKVEILVPPPSLLGTFDDFASSLFKQISNLTTQNERLKAARDLLLPRLMSGEIALNRGTRRPIYES
jgi:type I restriction enzyme S subunit